MSQNPVLFISLGTSPAIVPEAFFLPNANFGAVHVLTSEQPDVSLVRDFFQQHASHVQLTISRVKGFNELTTENDHFRFEEVLYRWLLSFGVPVDQRYICLSGGFKTMSAAMQKAAAVLGAAEVFHVLANGKKTQPSTIKEILDAQKHGRLHFIRLGPESGWPQFRGLPDFPLNKRTNQKGDWVISAPDDSFRRRLKEIVERSHNIAGAWDRLKELPFPILATWPQKALEWLNQPLDPKRDENWIRKLPKIELHCHLGGFATHGDLLQKVRDGAANPRHLPVIKRIKLPSGWPLPRQQVALDRYMHLGDNSGSTLLKDRGCLHRQCRLLYQHLRDQGILYSEIRCSPANYATPGFTPWEVLGLIRETFQNCMEKDPGCHVNLILIATRRKEGDFRAAISRHLALAISAAEHWTDDGQCRVVGVDLAGYEDKETRAHYFREEFIGIHRCGLALTVHAGENDDAEGIWRAVFDLNARRLGHALHLKNSEELMQSVAARGIGIEMCPYANYQIHPYALPGRAKQRRGRWETYPLQEYLARGIRVTVNTDNIGISCADLTQNLLLAARLCPGLTRLDILKLQSHALALAFLSPKKKEALINEFQNKLTPPQP